MGSAAGGGRAGSWTRRLRAVKGRCRPEYTRNREPFGSAEIALVERWSADRFGPDGSPQGGARPLGLGTVPPDRPRRAAGAAAAALRQPGRRGLRVQSSGSDLDPGARRRAGARGARVVGVG